MKKIFPLIFMMTMAWVGLTACSDTDIITQHGVELGNPDPTPTTIRITPEGGMTTYDLSFVDENQASLTRTEKNSGLKNNVLVPFQRTGTSVLVQASFPGLETIEVILTLNPKGQVVSVTLKINGQEVAAEFETSPGTVTGGGNSGGAKDQTIKFEGAPTEDQMEQPTISPTVDLDQPMPQEVELSKAPDSVDLGGTTDQLIHE